MTDIITDLEATSIRDQVDAHWRDVSDATARHYTTLIETGMDPKHAARLTRDFQEMLMEPASDEVHVIVEGD